MWSQVSWNSGCVTFLTPSWPLNFTRSSSGLWVCALRARFRLIFLLSHPEIKTDISCFFVEKLLIIWADLHWYNGVCFVMLVGVGLQDKREVVQGVYSVIDQLSRTHLNTLERLVFHLVRWDISTSWQPGWFLLQQFYHGQLTVCFSTYLGLFQDLIPRGHKPHVCKRAGHRVCTLHTALSRHHWPVTERPGHRQDHCVRCYLHKHTILYICKTVKYRPVQL